MPPLAFGQSVLSQGRGEATTYMKIMYIRTFYSQSFILRQMSSYVFLQLLLGCGDKVDREEKDLEAYKIENMHYLVFYRKVC